MITSCFEPLSGVRRQPITPQSKLSCRTSGCLTKLLIPSPPCSGFQVGLESLFVGVGERPLLAGSRSIATMAPASEKAIVLPSGDHAGSNESSPDVTCCTPLPSAPTV